MKYGLITVVITVGLLASAMNGWAQNPVTADSPYQIRYFSRLSQGDSFINITNSGVRGLPPAADICVNTYVFNPDGSMAACCASIVPSNTLKFYSLKKDLLSNTLTQTVPGAANVILLSTIPPATGCNAGAVTTQSLTPGLIAWGVSMHKSTTGDFVPTETPFTPATLSAGEFSHLSSTCASIKANAGGLGICGACQNGAK